MIKYRTWYDTRIEEVEVVSETTKFVTIEEGTWSPRKSLKHPDSNEYTHYHDTWEEARQFLIDREQAAIANLERQLGQHQETLEKIGAMHQ